jgi:3-oxoacyl-[acyl-carrier-protein] synthase-3
MKKTVKKMINSIIIGTGSYIPMKTVYNKDFLHNEFYDRDGIRIDKSNEEIIEKFKQITSIQERRYVTDNLVASDIGFYAAKDALVSSGTDKESIDYIIVGHNFGDVRADNKRSDFVPSLAARIKHKLNITNPKTVAYDLPFGCPAWLQGLIQADYYLKSGDAKKVMVIGTETLSRISDPHDRDSMIYADGAGATIIEAKKGFIPKGILSHNSRSDTTNQTYMLRIGKSNNPDYKGGELFLKMDGHKLYEYALKTVPQTIKDCIEKAILSVKDISKVLIHQANGKMDDAILKRLYGLFNIKEVPVNIMPMTISWLGNSSVATLPTLIDLLLKRKISGYRLKRGDVIVFASVGAGMNINSLAYRMP